MKKWMCILVLAVISLTAACSQEGTKSVIDWVDFLKIGDKRYIGVYEAVLTNESYLGEEEIGEVKFTVGDVVTKTDYKIKNGDAAYLPMGTKIKAIKGIPSEDVVTVRDENAVNGYKIYINEEKQNDYARSFDEVVKKEIEYIEIIHDDNVVNQLENQQKTEFMGLLSGGLNMESFTPDQTLGDPMIYSILMYTDGPFAYQYHIYDDHKQIYFNPDKTRILNGSIINYLSAG